MGSRADVPVVHVRLVRPNRPAVRRTEHLTAPWVEFLLPLTGAAEEHLLLQDEADATETKHPCNGVLQVRRELFDADRSWNCFQGHTSAGVQGQAQHGVGERLGTDEDVTGFAPHPDQQCCQDAPPGTPVGKLNAGVQRQLGEKFPVL